MSFKPNYNQQRAQRNRLKQAKAQAETEKLQARSDARKAARAASNP